jgi:hypothetical protein
VVQGWCFMKTAMLLLMEGLANGDDGDEY